MLLAIYCGGKLCEEDIVSRRLLSVRQIVFLTVGNTPVNSRFPELFDAVGVGDADQ